MKTEHFENAAGPRLARGIHDRDIGVGANGAAFDAPNADRTDIARVVERTYLHLERAVDIDIGRGHVLDDGLKQDRHIGLEPLRGAPRVTQGGRGIDHRKIELLLGCAETIE